MFATGKRAKGICDVCGFTCKYLELRALTQYGKQTAIKACKTCFDPDHPQNTIPRVRADAEMLRDPRPDNSMDDSRNTAWGFGPVNGLEAKTAIGTVTVR